MANQSINNILNSFKYDLARTNRFDVLISPPPALQNSSITELLSYRCEIAQLPGRHLSTVEQKTYGPFEKFPHHVTYNDIDLTFIVDGDMIEKYFFDAWLDYINPTNNFNIAYKEDYCTDIVITQYSVADLGGMNIDVPSNPTGSPIYQVTLVDAYPIGVNQLDLDWSNDGVHKLSVTFAYTYWYNDTQSPSNPIDFGVNSSWEASGENSVVGAPGF